MSEPVKVGSLVTFPGGEEKWRVVYVDADRDFARLEHAAKDGVRSRVVELSTLRLVLPDEPQSIRTPAQIVAEFMPEAAPVGRSERKTHDWPEGRTSRET